MILIRPRDRIPYFLAGLIGFLVAVVLIGLYLAQNVHECPLRQDASLAWRIGFASLAVFSLLGGGALATFGHKVLGLTTSATPPGGRAQMPIYVRGTLALSLWVTFGALLYETLAVGGFEGTPITTYVRCAATSSNWYIAAGVTVLLFGLIGNWVWFQSWKKWSESPATS